MILHMYNYACTKVTMIIHIHMCAYVRLYVSYNIHVYNANYTCSEATWIHMYMGGYCHRPKYCIVKMYYLSSDL